MYLFFRLIPLGQFCSNFPEKHFTISKITANFRSHTNLCPLYTLYRRTYNLFQTVKICCPFPSNETTIPMFGQNVQSKRVHAHTAAFCLTESIATEFATSARTKYAGSILKTVPLRKRSSPWKTVYFNDFNLLCRADRRPTSSES